MNPVTVQSQIDGILVRYLVEFSAFGTNALKNFVGNQISKCARIFGVLGRLDHGRVDRSQLGPR